MIEIEVLVLIISIAREQEENTVFVNVSVDQTFKLIHIFIYCTIVEEEEKRNKIKVSEEYSSTASLCQQSSPRRKVSIRIEDTGDNCYLAPPNMAKATSSSSNETLTGG